MEVIQNVAEYLDLIVLPIVILLYLFRIDRRVIRIETKCEFRCFNGHQAKK